MEAPYERPEVIATYSADELAEEAARCDAHYLPTATN
jgi:hypothetical protein